MVFTTYLGFHGVTTAADFGCTSPGNDRACPGATSGSHLAMAASPTPRNAVFDKDTARVCFACLSPLPTSCRPARLDDAWTLGSP